MTCCSQKGQHNQGIILLIAVTMLWGTTFPLVKETVASISPSLLIALRAGLATVAFALHLRDLNAKLLRDGALLGLLLFSSLTMQAIALQTLSANRAAFIASLYVILVPLAGKLLGKPVLRRRFLAALIALSGIGLMSWEGGLPKGNELWILVDVIFSTCYILTLDSVTPHHPPLSLTAVQLLVIAVLATLWTAPELLGQWEAIRSNFFPILYLASVTALTTWLITIAQNWVSAQETALIFTFEPVFAALISFFLLGETLGLRGCMGAAMVVGAMAISQSQTSSVTPNTEVITEEKILIPAIEPVLLSEDLCLNDNELTTETMILEESSAVLPSLT